MILSVSAGTANINPCSHIITQPTFHPALSYFIPFNNLLWSQSHGGFHELSVSLHIICKKNRSHCESFLGARTNIRNITVSQFNLIISLRVFSGAYIKRTKTVGGKNDVIKINGLFTKKLFMRENLSTLHFLIERLMDGGICWKVHEHETKALKLFLRIN